jgi:hypothetical protein
MEEDYDRSESGALLGGEAVVMVKAAGETVMVAAAAREGAATASVVAATAAEAARARAAAARARAAMAMAVAAMGAAAVRALRLPRSTGTQLARAAVSSSKVSQQWPSHRAPSEGTKLKVAKVAVSLLSPAQSR